MPLNYKKVQLLQIAMKAAGLRKPERTEASEAQYLFYLAQFKDSKGSPITSSKYLSNAQMDTILETCEELGWRNPNKSRRNYHGEISQAMIDGINALAGDLGWQPHQLSGMVRRMTRQTQSDPSELTVAEGRKVIEAMKAMLKRHNPDITGNNLTDIQQKFEFNS